MARAAFFSKVSYGMMKRLMELQREGSTDEEMIRVAKAEFDLDLSKPALKDILDNIYNKKDLYSQATAEYDEKQKREIHELLSKLNVMVAELNGELHRNFTLFKEVMQDPELSAYEKLDGINAINSTLRTLMGQIEILSKQVGLIKESSTNVKFTKIDVAMSVTEVLGKIDLCKECKVKRNRYLGLPDV